MNVQNGQKERFSMFDKFFYLQMRVINLVPELVVESVSNDDTIMSKTKRLITTSVSLLASYSAHETTWKPFILKSIASEIRKYMLHTYCFLAREESYGPSILSTRRSHPDVQHRHTGYSSHL